MKNWQPFLFVVNGQDNIDCHWLRGVRRSGVGVSAFRGRRFSVQGRRFSVQGSAFSVQGVGVQRSGVGVSAFRGSAFQRSASILTIRGAKLMSFAGRREMAPVAPSQMSAGLAKYLQ